MSGMRELDCLDLYSDAVFYDMEFAERTFDIPFFQQWAARSAEPILEVACGTGRITIPIASSGQNIVGLDASQPMLELAAEKSSRETLPITWVHQDCRDIQLEDRFSLIFSATNSMQHLLDNESVEAFLKSAAKHIKNDGTLLLDVMNPDVRRLARGSEEHYVQKAFTDVEGKEIRAEISSHYMHKEQILHFELSYTRGKKVIKTKTVNMRCFFPEELLALCRLTGWNVTQRMGDYDESPFTSTSPKQLLVCQHTGR